MLSEPQVMELRVRQFGMLVRMCPEVASENIRFNHSFDPVLEQLVFGLKGYFAAKDIDSKTVTYPQTWKDGAREALYAWMGRFGMSRLAGKLRQWWPCKITSVTMEATILLPGLVLPNNYTAVPKVIVTENWSY